MVGCQQLTVGVPLPLAVKPKEPPLAFQPTSLTVTVPLVPLARPFHRLLMLVPPGMVSVTVQPPVALTSTVPWKPPFQELFVV